MQLRENKPGVAAAGTWGFFGGTVHDGESPQQALIREIHEELGLKIRRCRLFARVDGLGRLRLPTRWWFFEVKASDAWDKHKLKEGQACGLFAVTDMSSLPMSRGARQLLLRHYRSNRRRRSTSERG